jgi:glycosyltransferase involved in cell wall biosynthesis
MTRILLSHPHAAAFAQGAALGLERAGLLASFVTGVAAADGTVDAAVLKLLARRWRTVGNRLLSGLSADHLRARWTVELAARLIGRSGLRFRDSVTAYDVQFVLHDLVVASSAWPGGIAAVYAYEDGALRTFERARARGLRRIWDLPIPHYLVLERMWRQEWTRWPEAAGASPHVEPEWKRRRKDRELELASEVVVASSFTRASLEERDIRVPIHVVPYGFPVHGFRPKPVPPSGPFTALAVGSHDLRKGTPYLLEAWQKAGLRGARLRLIGPMRLSPSFSALRAEGIEHVPHLPRSALEAEYQAADVLVFPTLGDGFGMVIQEAMCTATPVITTRCGGGPECISDGVEGFIVPERSVDGLVATLRRVAADRDRLAAIGRAARARAEAWTWEDAGARLQGVLA